MQEGIGGDTWISFDPFIPYPIPYLGKGTCETTIEVFSKSVGFCKRLISKEQSFLDRSKFSMIKATHPSENKQQRRRRQVRAN